MIYNTSWSNRFEIKKDRWVYNPTLESRTIGKQILKHLNKSWQKPDYYYHLRNGGHVEALKIHLENQFFATIDITDFFGYISRSRITRSLKSRLSYDLARKIAKVSTVKAIETYPHSHHLPYGFIQSPLLASICLYDSTLGKLLDSINKNNLAIISVYMDDIVISSNNENSLISIFNNLHVAAKKSNFILHPNKTKPVAPQTKAFNIVMSQGCMKIEYDRFVELQRDYAISDSEEVQHGIGSYVGSVNKQQAKLLI